MDDSRLTEDDIQAVVDVLRSDWLTTGPKVAEFEEAFAARVGAKYAVSFSSGTAALHGAAFAAGLKPGDEAITTPMTFAATANCVLYQGATPVFADVSADTLNLDPEKVAARITPRTRAVLPVDYAGHPADLDAMLELADAPRAGRDRGCLSRAGSRVSRTAHRQHRRHDRLQFSSGETRCDWRRRHGDHGPRGLCRGAAALS